MTAKSRAAGLSSKSVRQIVLGVAIALGVVVVAGGVVWTVSCPCETTPGFVLLGDAHEEPVDDWSFANDCLAVRDPDRHLGEAPFGERQLHGDAGGRALHQLLGRRPEVLVPAGGRGPSGPAAARRRRLPRRPEPRDGSRDARPRLGFTNPQAAEAGGAGAPAGGRGRAAAAGHAPAREAGGRSASSRAGSERQRSTSSAYVVFPASHIVRWELFGW